MGWDNPPMPWRELERRLSWRTGAARTGDEAHSSGGTADAARRRAAGTAGAGRRLRATRPPGAPWAELHCHSSYSFLDGASSPEDLVAEAARRGLTALAITDHD